MKTIEIIGDNYFGKWTETRTACRGIILREKYILMSYETIYYEKNIFLCRMKQ